LNVECELIPQSFDLRQYCPIGWVDVRMGEGDIYFDAVLKKLRVYDGTQWQNCW